MSNTTEFLAITTRYSMKEIQNFQVLTGCASATLEIQVLRFHEYEMDLVTINNLVKLGQFNLK